MKTSHGLARCGFGDELLEATLTKSRDELPTFLADWRARIREELRTNSRGMLDKRMLKMSREWPEDFPDLDVLYLYTNPVTSKTDASARKSHIPPEWKKECDFGQIARVCEQYFEWGFEEAIIKRFRTVLWSSAVQRIFRRAALEDDARRRGEPTVTRKQTSPAGVDYIGTSFALVKKYFSEADVAPPGAPLIKQIHASRNHAITDRLLEYRISILPEMLVAICKAGMKHTRLPIDTTFDILPSDMEGDGDDDGTGKKRAPKEAVDPVTPWRVWVPASIVRIARPDLVEEFEGGEARKVAAKAAKAARAAEKQAGGATAAAGAKQRRTRKKAPADFPLAGPEEEVETFDLGNVSGSDDGVPAIPTRPGRVKPASKPKATRKPATTNSRSRKKTAPAPFPSLRSDSIDLEDEPPRPVIPQPQPPPRAKPPVYAPLYLEDEDSFDSAPLRQFNSRPKPPKQPAPYLEDEDSFDATQLPRFSSQPPSAARPPLYLEDEDSDEAAPRPLFSSQPIAGPSGSMKGFFTVSKTTVTAKGKSSTTIKRTVDLTARRSPEPLIATPSTVVSSTVTSAASTRIATGGSSTVLDRLDKAAAKTRKFQRTESSNSAISAISSASVPQPFPLAFEPEDDFFSDDDRDALPSPPLPPQHTCLERTPSGRRARTPSLTQDSDGDTPRKSPRHNTRHSSPRRKEIELGSSPTPSPPRRQPRSPPRRTAVSRRPPPTHRPRKIDDSVIEINSSSSSGEDDSLSVSAVVASDMGRASAPSKDTSRRPLAPMQPSRAPVALADTSIIDLT